MTELKDNHKRIVPCWRLEDGQLISPTSLNRLSQIAGVKTFVARMSRRNTVHMDIFTDTRSEPEKGRIQQKIQVAVEEATRALGVVGMIAIRDESPPESITRFCRQD
jgi:hypothetical protein